MRAEAGASPRAHSLLTSWVCAEAGAFPQITGKFPFDASTDTTCNSYFSCFRIGQGVVRCCAWPLRIFFCPWPEAGLDLPTAFAFARKRKRQYMQHVVLHLLVRLLVQVPVDTNTCGMGMLVLCTFMFACSCFCRQVQRLRTSRWLLVGPVHRWTCTRVVGVCFITGGDDSSYGQYDL